MLIKEKYDTGSNQPLSGVKYH